MTNNEKICLAYFTLLEPSPDENNSAKQKMYKCKCDVERKKGNGWTNLMKHIKAQHSTDLVMQSILCLMLEAKWIPELSR